MLEDISLEEMPAAIESLLFVSDEPVSAVTLAKLFDENVEEIELALKELQKSLEESSRGIQLREIAGGWRMYTHPAYHELIERYVVSWDTRKLSSAALETLAIVSYMQPVTRAQVSAIRGVTSDGPMGTLADRGYIRESGVADTPGNPTLYSTTATFLEKYGLNTIADLPALEEFAPDEKTVQLIRERLGVPTQTETLPSEAELPSAEQMASDAQAALFGVVEKIDFDALAFNTDDE